MIRVNFVIDRLSRAGTETQLLALIREVDRSRVAPSLVLLDGTDPESRALAPPDCPVLCLGLKSFTRPDLIARSRRLVRFWREQRVDVVQTYFLDSTYFGVALAKLAGVRRVVRVRNNLGHWLTPTHKLLGRVVGRVADMTLTNSDKGKRALIEVEGLPERRVAVLENGVDLGLFSGLRPADTSGAVVRVGAVANLRPVKNIDGLIRAAALVRGRFPNVEFELAGTGEQRPELGALIDRLGLADHVRLVGPTADVPGFLSRLDVAVLPSHAEGMSNALLEYMAAGRPVVATAVGANPRLIADGESGLLVPRGDDEALSAAIGRFIAEPTLARRCGEAARRKVEAEFGRAAMCRRFEAFYERLAA